MHAKGLARRRVVGGIAACALFAAIVVPPAAFAAQGDGATEAGSVVSTGDGASPDSAPANAPAAPEPEPDEPEPLDAEGNEVNDGQVADTSFLYDAAIADLAGADSYYDGQTVQVRGEAVGEAMRMAGSGDEVWVALVDVESGSSVSVVMKRSDADKIDTYGAYGKTGTRLRVQGVYNLACSEHEGESDIHATTVAVEEKGSSHPDSFDAAEFVPGVAAVVAGAVLMAVFWYVRERAR